MNEIKDFIRERICFYSSMFPHSSSAYEISALADKLGAAGVELMNFCTELKTPDMKVAREIGAYLRERNLTIPCFSCGINLVKDDGGASMKNLRGYADICAELGIHSVYRENSALLILSLGHGSNSCPVPYTIYINHGRGGGRRPGGKINALQDYGNIIDADIYVVGHTHMPASFKDQIFRIAPHKGTAHLRERLFVNTASALRYGSYGERLGYQPASNSYPIIVLDGRQKRMTATL